MVLFFSECRWYHGDSADPNGHPQGGCCVCGNRGPVCCDAAGMDTSPPKWSEGQQHIMLKYSCILKCKNKAVCFYISKLYAVATFWSFKQPIKIHSLSVQIVWGHLTVQNKNFDILNYNPKSLMCFWQMACEKTVSVLHHVIKRTITFAKGKPFCSKPNIPYTSPYYSVSDIVSVIFLVLYYMMIMKLIPYLGSSQRWLVRIESPVLLSSSCGWSRVKQTLRILP